MQKYVPLVKQNVIKFEVFILGGQRIDQKRKKGRGSRVERKETKGNRVNNLKREDKEHRHLPLLVVQLPQGTTFLLSSRLDSAVKRCSSEVLFSSGAAW